MNLLCWKITHLLQSSMPLPLQVREEDASSGGHEEEEGEWDEHDIVSENGTGGGDSGGVQPGESGGGDRGTSGAGKNNRALPPSSSPRGIARPAIRSMREDHLMRVPGR